MAREEQRFVVPGSFVAGKGGLPKNFEELWIEGLPVDISEIVLGFFLLLFYDSFHEAGFCWVEKHVNIWQF